MKKEKAQETKKEMIEETNEKIESNVTGENQESSTVEPGEDSNQLEQINEKLEAKTKQCDEYFNMLQRTMAEFDNFKKRTAKEKLDLYSDAVCDAIGAILPVLDNFERAMQASGSSDNSGSLKEGIELVYKQFKEVFKNIGVEEIKAAGESFNPNLHNAVMHVEDDTYGENVIVEEFQKGYIYKEKVIRYSMVKVAN